MQNLSISTIIGMNIVKIRKEKNLSQEDLAGKAKVSLSTIKRYEEGDNQCINTLEKITTALNITFNDLLSGETNSKKLNDYYVLKKTKGDALVFSLKVLYANRIIIMSNVNNTNQYQLNTNKYPIVDFLKACEKYENIYNEINNQKQAYRVLDRIEDKYSKLFNKI